MENNQFDKEKMIKICFMGQPSDLKTKWIWSFAEGKFTINYLPIQGVDISTKRIEVEKNIVKLVLVDTTGQQFFGKLRPSYYRGASAAVITFDKGDKKSFSEVNDCYAEFKERVPDPSIPIALVGFVTEVEEITTKKGQELAEKLQLKYYETKVTDKETIATITHDLTLEVIQKRDNE